MMDRDDESSTDAPRERATASSVGVALLVLIAVALSATVGATALSVTPASAPPTAVFDLTVADETLTLTHGGGDAVDVRSLRLAVSVDGESLRFEPSVPFFASRGFRSGPTGPFNRASDPTWTAGETASFGVAGTNRPHVVPGAFVEVELTVGTHRLAAVSATAH